MQDLRENNDSVCCPVPTCNTRAHPFWGTRLRMDKSIAHHLRNPGMINVNAHKRTGFNHSFVVVRFLVSSPFGMIQC